jgi:hypothetical protein
MDENGSREIIFLQVTVAVRSLGVMHVNASGNHELVHSSLLSLSFFTFWDFLKMQKRKTEWYRGFFRF